MPEIDIRIACWNANGLISKRTEIEFFLNYYKIDILLLSETHTSPETSILGINGYTIILSHHPSGRCRGGAGILIKNNIQYEQIFEWSSTEIQLIAIRLSSLQPKTTLAAIYCPPNTRITREDFTNCFTHIPKPFLMGGDFNAKHTWWASRIINPRGRELLSCIQNNNYLAMSTGAPTFYSTNTNNIPDLLDFFISSGIPTSSTRIGELPELYSDHIAILCVLKIGGFFETHRRKTNFARFRHQLNERLIDDLPLDTPQEIEEAIGHFNAVTTSAIEDSTDLLPNHNSCDTSLEVRNLIAYKRRLRVLYQTTQNRFYKTQWNSACKRLRTRLCEERDEQQRTRLQGLSADCTTNYSLWKAVSIKKPTRRNVPLRSAREWIRSDQDKANLFADHLEQVFTPNQVCHPDPDHENFIKSELLNFPPLEPLEPTSQEEVLEEIRRLNTKKSPGIDAINSKVIKAFPQKAIAFILALFNALLQQQYFPQSWKCAIIIMIEKPDKPAEEVTSYRPISLLPIISKMFERIILRRLSEQSAEVIPDHQFGFRKGHGTIQQCHRIVATIRNALEEKKYCPAVFLDISQAFDKVWHDGLMWKIKERIPKFYRILQSFVRGRTFVVRYSNDRSSTKEIHAGVPQGSVLGPFLYCLATGDFEIADGVTTGTFADDTAFLTTHADPNVAAERLQMQLHMFHEWCDKWKVKVNPNKCVNVNFTLRRGVIPEVEIYGTVIPKEKSARYLGLHLDSSLNWGVHIQKKKKQLKLATQRLSWLLRPGSGLSVENRLLVYKVMLMPMWTYGAELWGSASASNIKKMQSAHCSSVRRILGAPWFVRNCNIMRDTKLPSVQSVIRERSQKHWAKVISHENSLMEALTGGINIRRLKRWHVDDLGHRNDDPY